MIIIDFKKKLRLSQAKVGEVVCHNGELLVVSEQHNESTEFACGHVTDNLDFYRQVNAAMRAPDET